MADGTDLIKLWCPGCELEWDVWGTEIDAHTFIPDRQNAQQCPACLLRGVPTEPESLA